MKDMHARNPTRAPSIFLQTASWGECSNGLSSSIDFTEQIHRKTNCLAQQNTLRHSGFKQNAEIYSDTEHSLWTSENQTKLLSVT